MALNIVALTGRLTADPEVKHLDDGKVVAKFTLAVQRTKEVADFIPVETWNKTAESIEEYISKGSLIAVEGSIRVEKYEAQDGTTRTFTKVLANKIHFLDTKTSASQEE